MNEIDKDTKTEKSHSQRNEGCAEQQLKQDIRIITKCDLSKAKFNSLIAERTRSQPYEAKDDESDHKVACKLPFIFSYKVHASYYVYISKQTQHI